MRNTFHVVTGLAMAGALMSVDAARAQGASAASSSLEGTWGEGSRLVHQGVVALTNADKVLTDAARKGIDAMARQSTSGANSLRASEEFRRLAASTPTSQDAAEAQRWAGIVEAAATQWLGFQSQEREATRDLNAAIQQNAGAQKSIEAAMAQVERGRQLSSTPPQTDLGPNGQNPADYQPATPAAPTPAPARRR